jgi:hypothetical protein
VTNWSYGLVPALIASKDVEVYIKAMNLKPGCIVYLKELSEAIKHSPERLIRLLIYILAADFKYLQCPIPSFQCALNIYQAVYIAKDYFLDIDMGSYIAYVHNLAWLFAQSRDLALEHWKLLLDRNENAMEQLGDKEDFSVTCTQVIHDLLMPHISTFGIHASRSLCCARPIIEDDAARGWLGMYEGERYRPHSKALIW